MRTLSLLIILSVFFLSCDHDIEFISYSPKIVVEGYMVSGNYASVLLSVSASMEGPKDTLSLLGHVIKSAKVTVSNGIEEEILTLQTNKNKMPPYEYVGTKIRGEAGNIYTLRVEYDGNILTSSTHIPQSVNLDDIWFAKNAGSDTLGYIHVSFRNISDEFYQVATRKISDSHFTPCLYGNIDASVYPEGQQINMQINKGPVLYPKTDYTTYFNLSDTIVVRFSTQPYSSYRFWTSYENELLNTQNPIFPANTSLASNIDGDGIGVWCGFGSNEYRIVIKNVLR